MKKFNIMILALFLFISPMLTNAQWIDVSSNLPDFGVGWAIDAIDNSTAIVSGSGDGKTDLFKTTDTGNTWNAIDYPKKDGYELAIDISFVDELNIWIATDPGRILRTTDGGTNWTVQFENAALTKYMNYIEMFDVNNGVAMGDAAVNGGPAVFLTTTTGGNEWTVHTATIGEYSGDTWRRLDFVNPNVGYFFESGINPQKLYKTTDGCQSWIEINSDINCQVLKAYDENTVLANNFTYPSENSFYRTVDGGSTWNVLPFINRNWGNDIEFCPENPSMIWYTEGRGVYFSSDMGETWTLQMSVDEGDISRDIKFFDSQNGWLFSNNAVYLTTNGGMSVTEVIGTTDQLPTEFSLSQNYPNPFNPTTTIKYSIPFVKTPYMASLQVNLKVFDLLGNEVAVLVNEYKSPGEYEIEFDASQLPSGVYFYKLTAGDFSQSRKMILMK
ncbi:MAG: T9SS type A sorting domain-containing protein [bacterium]